ncbi:DUF4097 family beta strand repeat-containing protein [Actinomadura scrupuli]|uniref:DUF4097 family beta strand repeat-containing protein n=1 Tax=Actinomadura scrupuli TaxID=559629 RepID=UPI003D9833D4
MKSLAGAVLMTGAAVAALTGCGANFTSTTYHADNNYPVLGQIGKLKVRLDSDNVRIIGGDSATISVHERLSYTKNRRPAPYHTTEGGTLALGYRCPDGLTIGFNRCSVSYTIQVPRGISVDVNNDSGRITMSGIGGDVNASVSSGDFTGTDLRGNQVTVDADSGNIRLVGVAGSVRASASSGNIYGENLRGGKLNADADSGNVTLKFAAVPSDVMTKASSGNIRLWLPGGQSYAVNASVDSGNKNIDVPTDPASPHRIRAIADSGNVSVIPADAP